MIPETLEDRILLKNCEYLDLEKTFECGQCFRWMKTGENEYTGVVSGRVIRAASECTGISFFSDNMENLTGLISDYFSLETDYEEINRQIDTDEHLSECISYAKGIRILRQDPFETMISFIISQNNNIPRIRGIIDRICRKYGRPITFEGKTFYSFPSPEALSQVSADEFRALGTGFRDKYLVDAVNRVTKGELDLNALHSLSTDDARNRLMKVKGIGRKVADCILLFSYSRLEICPVDVWMKKIFSKYYDIKEKDMDRAFCLSAEKWGEYAGIAQQYLFYYEREES